MNLLEYIGASSSSLHWWANIEQHHKKNKMNTTNTKVLMISDILRLMQYSWEWRICAKISMPILFIVILISDYPHSSI